MSLRRLLNLGVVIGMALLGLTHGPAAARQDDAEVAARIASAMRAARPSISQQATILDHAVDDTGHFVVLREGRNGWFCFPDNPVSPGQDPQCLDQTWLDWTYAYLAGEEPDVPTLGIAYLLQGGSDASTSDPLATEPAPGEDWIQSPPHIRLLVPRTIAPSIFTADQLVGDASMMWAGTPYESILLPVSGMVPVETPMCDAIGGLRCY